MELNAESLEMYARAVHCFRDGRLGETEQVLGDLVKREPNNAMVWALYGYALANMSRHTEAKESLKKAESFNSDDPRVWYNIGAAYVKMSHMKSADKAFSKSRKVDKEYDEKTKGALEDKKIKPILPLPEGIEPLLETLAMTDIGPKMSTAKVVEWTEPESKQKKRKSRKLTKEEARRERDEFLKKKREESERRNTEFEALLERCYSKMVESVSTDNPQLRTEAIAHAKEAVDRRVAFEAPSEGRIVLNRRAYEAWTCYALALLFDEKLEEARKAYEEAAALQKDFALPWRFVNFGHGHQALSMLREYKAADRIIRVYRKLADSFSTDALRATIAQPTQVDNWLVILISSAKSGDMDQTHRVAEQLLLQMQNLTIFDITLIAEAALWLAKERICWILLNTKRAQLKVIWTKDEVRGEIDGLPAEYLGWSTMGHFFYERKEMQAAGSAYRMSRELKEHDRGAVDGLFKTMAAEGNILAQAFSGLIDYYGSMDEAMKAGMDFKERLERKSGKKPIRTPLGDPIKCPHCKAAYKYPVHLMEAGQVECQNCGKQIKI